MRPGPAATASITKPAVVPSADAAPATASSARIDSLSGGLPLVVCDECDAVYARESLAPGTVARCTRCGALVGRGHRLTAESQLALAAAALVVFVIGNASDIVTLDLRGVRVEVPLYEAILHTWSTDQPLVALLAAATTLGFPLAVIALRLWVLAPIVAGRRPAGFVPAMHALRWVTRWSMVEVFMLGTLVAVVRSAGVASVVPGAGIFAYAALTVLLTASQALGMHRLWRAGAQLP